MVGMTLGGIAGGFTYHRYVERKQEIACWENTCRVTLYDRCKALAIYCATKGRFLTPKEYEEIFGQDPQCPASPRKGTYVYHEPPQNAPDTFIILECRLHPRNRITWGELNR